VRVRVERPGAVQEWTRSTRDTGRSAGSGQWLSEAGHRLTAADRRRGR